MLLALEDGTSIDMYTDSGGGKTQKTVLNLNKHSLLIMDRTCVHGGAGYDKDNIRLFAAYDTTTDRLGDKTFKFIETEESGETEE
eukprot:4188541-Prorocentrum_lima.AAC.1